MKIFGIRLSMLVHLYRRRLRAHPAGELLAGGGVAIGVALVFGVLLANASLTSSAGGLVHGLAGSARFALQARSQQGFNEGIAEAAGRLPGVQVAAPVLRGNVTLSGAKGGEEVQLIGVTPSLEALGGIATQEIVAAEKLLKGGVGLPAGVARSLGAHQGTVLKLAAGGAVHAVGVRVVLNGDGLPALASSPVAVAVLGEAQALLGRPHSVSEVLVAPQPGKAAEVARELKRLAGPRIDVRPADDELRLLNQATGPNRKSTSLFSAIAVMIGFLLALNAILLTVPERRRFVAELRMQGYEPRQILILLGSQALVLGLAASLVGVGAGDVLSRAFFQRVPGFLTAAFPIGAAETVHAGTVLAAVGCGVLATALASLAPMADIHGGRLADGLFRRRGRPADAGGSHRGRRGGRPADALLRDTGAHSEIVRERTVTALATAGAALIVATLVLTLVAPGLTIGGGVALALACICLTPAAFAGLAQRLPRLCERIRSGALIVALSELRATTTRSVALAGIVGLAVYGGVAIGGARNDLLGGIKEATDQYFATAPVWITSGKDVFNTNNFDGAAAAARVDRTPGVASVRIYQGGLLDVGARRMWVRARPPGDGAMFESSQLKSGGYETATSRLRAGGWAAVSSDFAEERRLKVGSPVTLPTPTGPARLQVAAILTNSGWPAGTITLSAADYRRWWGTTEAAAVEATLKPGVSPAQGARAARAALAAYPGLLVRTAGERAAQSLSSARQGLRTLGEISTLLLIAAALAVASALSATIWQRRSRLAALKIQGYDSGRLWRAVLIESAFTIAVGAVVGAALGICGHALASRFLERTTGFPAPFSLGAGQVGLTLALIAAIALAVIALPGMAAARVSPRAVLQD
jgi:putative ABC transport system permease protein